MKLPKVMQNNKDKDKEKVNIIKSVSIFKSATPDIFEEIADSLEEISIDKDEVVFHKGDLLNAMYLIAEGSVVAHDGEYEFARFSENEYFGEYSLIDSSVRSATVTALEETRLFRLDKSVFDDIITKNVDIAKAVLKSLIKRLRNNNILEEHLTQTSYELREEKAEIEDKKKQLEELNATKDKFFNIIAHDLKNPFNTVIGLSELLLYRYNSYDDDKIKEFIGQIHQFSLNAYNLLDNLLQWARSQTNRIQVKPEIVNMKDLVEENYNLLINKAKEKNITLKYNLNDSPYVFADKNMVNTVVRNLISNAIKFTPENGHIKVSTANYNADYLQISVEDNGIGIAEEDIPKLFELTTNYTTEGTNSEKGTGLGLILCKEFVEKNEGQIWVEPKHTSGTIFKFTLPKKQLKS